jgi:hypothetical protein
MSKNASESNLQYSAFLFMCPFAVRRNVNVISCCVGILKSAWHRFWPVGGVSGAGGWAYWAWLSDEGSMLFVWNQCDKVSCTYGGGGEEG